VTTVQHAHLVPVIESYLAGKGIAAAVREGSGRTPYRGQVLGCTFAAARIPETDTILYIGTGMFHAIGVALATRKRVIALDPYTGEVREAMQIPCSGSVLPLLKKQKPRRISASCSVPRAGRHGFDLARRLASLSDRAFLVTMREISEGELLNLGFGCYVNTACPRLAYDDQARFRCRSFHRRNSRSPLACAPGTTMLSMRFHETQRTRDAS
jgi:2-(3-amino-3-carboxypropyl)histidine synthase